MRWGVALLFLAGCATRPVEYPRHPLIQEVLTPLPGQTTLVNRRRVVTPSGGFQWETVSYDLADPKVREELRKLKFYCTLGDEDYIPDETRPGLSRQTYTQSCFLFICGARQVATDDYIPVADTQRLIDARAVCYSFPQYGIGQTFGGAQ